MSKEPYLYHLNPLACILNIVKIDLSQKRSSQILNDPQKHLQFKRNLKNDGSKLKLNVCQYCKFFCFRVDSGQKLRTYWKQILFIKGYSLEHFPQSISTILMGEQIIQLKKPYKIFFKSCKSKISIYYKFLSLYFIVMSQ